MNTRNIKFTIGGPESPAGTEAARTAVLPIREKPGFRETPEKLEDPAIVGRNMVAGEYIGARNLNGPIPLSPRPCAGFGMALNSLLGQEGAPKKIHAVVRIRYNGTEDSAKISASATGDTLTSEIGELGAEAGDAAFGTAGVIDLTDIATDTVAEVVTVIAGYTDYEAELVTGDEDIGADSIVDIVAEQGKGRWVYLYFSSAFAVVQIQYTGAAASCLLAADTDVDELTSDIGALGSEIPDTDFGTAGVIDLTGETFDTVTELVAVINGYTDYTATLAAGVGTVASETILTLASTQAKGGAVELYFTLVDPGLYRHQWPVILANTARPTYSVQGDGLHENYLGLGVQFDAMTLSGALKAMVEAEMTAMGFSWTPGEGASVVDLEAVDPFLYYNGSFSLNGVTQPFVRNISIEIANNGNAEGFGMGSASRQYHDKGLFGFTATLQIRYSEEIYELYEKVFSNAQAGFDVYFKTPSVLAGEIHGLLIVEAPYCNVSDYDASDNNGVLDASINLKGVNPPGAYGSPLRITMITSDAAAY